MSASFSDLGTVKNLTGIGNYSKAKKPQKLTTRTQKLLVHKANSREISNYTHDRQQQTGMYMNLAHF